MRRLLDILVSALALLALQPVFAVIALLVKVDSKGPVFFRQKRVGKAGKLFSIHKFRTMHILERGDEMQISPSNDRRVTKVGVLLRKYKLDELPQLLDVLRGSMSLVGPRPEVPRYVDLFPEQVRQVILSVRPGITDLASVAYRSEGDLLANSEDPEQTYINDILPKKIELSCWHIQHGTFLIDLRILLKTIFTMFR